MKTEETEKKPLAGHILATLVGLMLVGSAVGKLSGVQMMVDNFIAYRLLDFIVPIALVELCTAILFVIPKTSSLGTLLVTAYFGGAVVAHLGLNDVAGCLPALVVGALAWVANSRRNPGMFGSFVQ